ncbi:hypothetical protein Tco_1451346, partial [Tanacetum coccineum]
MAGRHGARSHGASHGVMRQRKGMVGAMVQALAASVPRALKAIDYSLYLFEN